MREAIDALFLPFYVNVDRWHNDEAGEAPPPSVARTRATLSALDDAEWMKDEVDLLIEGRPYDFSRYLSWARYGTTSEWARYDPFNMTLLSGSYYLSLLHRHGFRVRVANVASRQNLPALAERFEPRYVLLSTTLLFDAAERDVIPQAVRQIRRAFPGAIVVLGGLMLVSYEKNAGGHGFEGTLLHYGADAYVVTPRGEAPLLEMLRRQSLQELADDPPACTYVRRDGRMQPPPARLEPDLGIEDGYIRWSALPQTGHLYHTVHTRTARSCAFACAFCEYPVNQGPLTTISAEALDRELSELKALGSVRSLVFTDDTFNVPLRRFKELLRVLARYDFEWYSFFRPQYADAETAELMQAAHCRAVFAGLESVDDQVLKNMHKVATADAYRRGLEQLKKRGIEVHANFIVGFPGETEASARKIGSFLVEMDIEFCTVCVWSYIPSTPIAARKAEFGIEGWGLDWKHNTMSSQEAQTVARQVIGEQKRSVHNSVRGEAWTEFLLYANGFTVDEVKLAISSFNRGLGRDNTEAALRASPDFAALRAVLERRPMPAPSLS
jgi:radical SAM family protein